MNVIIYSALNIGLTPHYGDLEKNEDSNSDDYGNHIKKKIQWTGIPIYIIGDIIYKYILDKNNINIIPKFLTNLLSGFNIEQKLLEEGIFRLTWQTFFNSLIYNNFKELIIDDLIVLLSMIIVPLSGVDTLSINSVESVKSVDSENENEISYLDLLSKSLKTPIS